MSGVGAPSAFSLTLIPGVNRKQGKDLRAESSQLHGPRKRSPARRHIFRPDGRDASGASEGHEGG